jgi:tryptophan synthase beta chain
MFGLKVRVYMVRVSWEQKPSRRSMMETWGAEVIPSPSSETNRCRSSLDSDPDSLGSLGIAVSEAVEEAVGVMILITQQARSLITYCSIRL